METRSLTPAEVLALLHPPGDWEHSISFARRTWMPLGWPIDAEGRPVSGKVSRIVGQHPADWRWDQLWNVFAGDVSEVLPQVAGELREDSFVSLCGMIVPRQFKETPSRAAGGPRKFGKYRTTNVTVQIRGANRRLPRAYRSRAHVRSINAAWVDLDFYKLGLVERDVLDRLASMESSGELPPISMRIYSGRGVWALWLLRDERLPYLATRAAAANLAHWRAVQKALHERFAQLGSDQAVHEVARMARMPGSVRTDITDRPFVVRWEVAGALDGELPPTYSISELRQRLLGNLGLEAAQVSGVGSTDAETRRKKQRGRRGRFFQLFCQLAALEGQRGGWKVGTRGRGLWLLAATWVSVRKWCRKLDDLDRQSPLMQLMGQTNNRTLEASVQHIASRCESSPDFNPTSETLRVCKRAIREGGLGHRRTGGKPPSHATISEWLRVTPTESLYLRALQFRSPLPPARAFWSDPNTSPIPHIGRVAAMDARRACLRQLIADRTKAGEPQLSLRVLARQLGKLGHGASPKTVRNDLIELGLTSSAAGHAHTSVGERRRLADRAGVDMRTLDRALWQWSKVQG